MSLRHVFTPRRNLGSDPRVALMLDRIGKDERPAGAIRKGLTGAGAAVELEKRLPPPYARAY